MTKWCNLHTIYYSTYYGAKTQEEIMKKPTFIPTIIHTVASGIDVSKDLASEQQCSVASLLDKAYEENQKEEKN